MSPSPFIITEHFVDCQHVREYARATATERDVALTLAVKQYVPLDNLKPQPGDVTIIATHGSGFPKELYEPLWEDIYEKSKTLDFRIRSIWMADASHQGMSGVINEHKIGNDPSWFDHSRDLLSMINHFREQMPRPLIGVGHSMGASQLVALSLMHPRLLSTLILLEPIIGRCVNSLQGPTLAKLSTFRRDLWGSRAQAQESARKSYKRWDGRVLQRWTEYGFRTLPTVIYPEDPVTRDSPSTQRQTMSSDTPQPEIDLDRWFKDRWLANSSYESSQHGDAQPVTLTTTKHQEVMSYLRPNFEGKVAKVDRLTHADLIGPPEAIHPFYRAEPVIIYRLLPHVRPSILYISGGASIISTPQFRQKKLERTGRGVGGSGGAAEGRVREAVVEGRGHLLPFEAIAACADAAAPWIEQELHKWKRDESRIAKGWTDKSLQDKSMVSNAWVMNIKSQL